MTSIKQLSERIASNTATLDAWLTETNAKAPSFEEDGEEEFPSTRNLPKIEAARVALIEDTKALHDLISGPGDVVRLLCWGSVDNAVQQCIYKFDFLHKVPLGGKISYPDLAAAVGLTEPQTRGLVRQSAINTIFREDGPDHVVHTAASAMLVRNKAMRDWYGHSVEEMFPAGAKLGEALEKYSSSMAPQDCGFGIAFNTKEPIYTWFEQNPSRQARFFGAMEGVGKDHGHSLQHIANGFPYETLKNGTVVDVGGSSGHLSVELARTHANLDKIIVQDYKETVEGGAKMLPADLKDRVEFMAHDFFQPQPVIGADAYIMRHICHNWSAESSAKIIQQIIPAMRANSKILIVDVVVTAQGADESSIAERYMRNVDIIMLQMLNNQERSVPEWQKLVALASDKLELTAIRKPKGSWDSIIELSLRPESS